MGYDGAGKVISDIGMISHVGEGEIVLKCEVCGKTKERYKYPSKCGKWMKEVRVKCPNG